MLLLYLLRHGFADNVIEKSDSCSECLSDLNMKLNHLIIFFSEIHSETQVVAASKNIPISHFKNGRQRKGVIFLNHCYLILIKLVFKYYSDAFPILYRKTKT